MCGIVGYIGPRKNAHTVLTKGLKHLEYRGYDSAGIALLTNSGAVEVFKKAGKVNELISLIGDRVPDSSVGIAHTRWATTGEPNDTNSHPHGGCREEVFVVHNGIIENFAALKEYLEGKGHVFASDTDTELIPHLIEETPVSDPPEIRVRKALQHIKGTYGIIVIFKQYPELLIAARHGSPLVVGIGVDEYFIASDPTAFIEYTKTVVHMEDDQIAVVSRNGNSFLKMTEKEGIEKVDPQIDEITWSISEIERGGYEYFMLKEIYDQPACLTRAMSGRVRDSEIVLGGIRDYLEELLSAPLVVLFACGTSWHAALIGEMYLEEIAGIPAEVKYASELANQVHPCFPEGTVCIAISQSGETKDTDLAIQKMQGMGYRTLGIVNAVGSTIARHVSSGVYIHAGPEIGVASTKAFTSQVLTLLMLAFHLGQRNNFIKHTFEKDWPIKLIKGLRALPTQVQMILNQAESIKNIALEFSKKRNFLFLGRGVNFSTALEGALKLKEISYIHAEGYPAAEMKHGPIALIDKDMPSVVIAPSNDIAYEKVCNNIGEIRTRKGVIIAVATEGDTQILKLAEHVFYVPNSSYFLTPILSVIVLQLLAYYVAVVRGHDVDMPRNLAKSVTVE